MSKYAIEREIPNVWVQIYETEDKIANRISAVTTLVDSITAEA